MSVHCRVHDNEILTARQGDRQIWPAEREPMNHIIWKDGYSPKYVITEAESAKDALHRHLEGLEFVKGVYCVQASGALSVTRFRVTEPKRYEIEEL